MSKKFRTSKLNYSGEIKKENGFVHSRGHIILNGNSNECFIVTPRKKPLSDDCTYLFQSFFGNGLKSWKFEIIEEKCRNKKSIRYRARKLSTTTLNA
jgi:hypothetical protein